MIKGLIFDMDGTILNTIEDIKESVNHAMRYFGLEEKTLQEVKDGVGRGAMNLIEDVVPKGTSALEIKKVYDVYQKHYDEFANAKTAPYPDILYVLKSLKDQGYQLAVVSNKLEYLVKELNDQTFKGYFDFSIGETDHLPIKPAPDMLYKALDGMNFHKDEVLFIGDSDVDMMTAINANIKSVGVTWGYRTKEVLQKYHPIYLIDEPKELLKIVNEVNAYGND